jgi:hypothetical protein
MYPDTVPDMIVFWLTLNPTCVPLKGRGNVHEYGEPVYAMRSGVVNIIDTGGRLTTSEECIDLAIPA